MVVSALALVGLPLNDGGKPAHKALPTGTRNLEGVRDGAGVAARDLGRL